MLPRYMYRKNGEKKKRMKKMGEKEPDLEILFL